MKKTNRTSYIFTIAFLLFSCNQHADKNNKNNDWNTGKVEIVADSNLKAVLEPLVTIYKNYYPNSDVSFLYTTEDNVISDFKLKKNNVIAISRLLSENEIKNTSYVHDVTIEKITFAYDAIAVIANPAFKDSIYKIENTADYLQNNKIKLIFDSPKSGIARTLMKLSNTSSPLFKNAYSLSSTKDVLAYVASHEDAIGFIPFNLLSNRFEKEAQHIRSDFKILSVSLKDTIINISQKSIADQQYPLVRPISIYIGNCPDLVVQGFTSFLLKRQIAKAILLNGIVPQNMPMREVIVTDEFNPNEKR